jgi:PIN domain nuclease of toxin-antitoxin system
VSKLLKLKEQLTVAEAAHHLSILLGEEVSEPDVLRFALDGRVQLSVFFQQPTSALLGTITTVEDVSDHLPGDGVIPFDNESMDPSEEAYWQSYYSWASNNDSVLIDRTSRLVLQVKSHERISGLWDLTMYGEERSYAENKYRDLVTTPQNSNEEPQVGGIAVVKKPDEKTDEAYGLLPTPLRHPVSCLPTTSRLVVRTVALQELQASISDAKPLAKRERNTLLVIIAALAKIAKVDVDKPSAAASVIASETERMGVRVSDRAILNHLNRIPDALADKAED